MKIDDIYEEMKSKYIDVIVLIKSGKFYLAFDNDATIISYLFDYKKKKGRVGFPSQGLNKVLKEFDKNRISYAIYDGSIVLFDDNNYYDFFDKANKDIIISNMVMDLTNKVKEVVSKDSNNYRKIKEYINEL